MPNGDGVSGEAYESGSGAVLLLLHGLGGSWHAWAPVLPILERHHRVLALTLPGHHGGPALPAGAEPSVDVLADALLLDLRARGIGQAHVAGNSLGGWLALELARRGFARSVTALSPAGGWRNQRDYRAIARPFRILFALMGVLLALTAWLLRFAGVRHWLNGRTMRFGERMSATEMVRAMRSLGRTLILPGLLRSMGKRGPIRALDPGGTPICIAWGEHDRVIPFDIYGPAVIEAVPGAEALIVKGVGHVPMYDDPEQVAAVILSTARRAAGMAA